MPKKHFQYCSIQYRLVSVLKSAIYCFVSFELGQIARSRADASKMPIALGVAICTADGLPPPTYFLHACPLAEVRILARNFQPSCSRFILGAASVEMAWNKTRQNKMQYNETGSNWMARLSRTATNGTFFTKQSLMFLETFFDVYTVEFVQQYTSSYVI